MSAALCPPNASLCPVAAAVASVGGHGLMDVTVDLSKFSSPYAHITVRDDRGGRAWTNPVWFE